MGDNYQSGKTQAIDLDELHVDTTNRPKEATKQGDFELDRWGDDPWSSTEESRKKRRWADDAKWAGDDEKKEERPEDKWEVNEEDLKGGWHAPKRGDVLETSEGWEDWAGDGAPKEFAIDQEIKENGGYHRVQAASQYVVENSTDYLDGRAKRDDIYKSKEVFGTSGIRERKGDPYAMVNNPSIMPEMTPISEWNDPAPDFPSQSANKDASEPPKPLNSDEEDDMRASAKISSQAQNGDDIPGITRASIIIFHANSSPSDIESVTYELKKMTTTIGRALDNMVILNDEYASRKQLTINYVNGCFQLFSLSNDNLASVNGYPISHIQLVNGDLIEVGATRIRFVLGAIPDNMRTSTMPINGTPIHLDPPPQEVRSPQTMRKNLILLISGIGVIVVCLIAFLIIIANTDHSKNKDEVAKQTEQTEAATNGKSASKADVKLTPEDAKIIDSMAEALGVGINHYHDSGSKVIGKRTHIEITSEPEGARIYNPDGSLRGFTPYDVQERFVEGKEVDFVVRMDGFDEKKLELELDKGVKEKVELLAQNDVKQASPDPDPEEKPKPEQEKPVVKTPPKPVNSGGGKSGGGKAGGGKAGGGKSGGGKSGGGSSGGSNPKRPRIVI